MQQSSSNQFDHTTLEMMMERYRAELLRYQRATAPGKPTLAQNADIMRGQRAVPPVSYQVQNTVMERPVQQEQHKQRPAYEEQTKTVYETEDEIKPSCTQKSEIEPLPQQNAAEIEPEEIKPEEICPPAVEQVEILPQEQSCPQQEELEQEQPCREELEPEPPQTEQEPQAEPQQDCEDSQPAPQSIMEPDMEETLPQTEYIEPPLPKARDDFGPQKRSRIFHTEFEKCIGAYGEFKPYERMGRYTAASFLQIPGKPTPVLVRFAADVASGAADSARCRRSFSVKFFCEDGEYDMLGEHLPVTVGAGEEVLDDCCLAMRPDPRTGMRSHEAFWRFLLKHNEALPAALWLYTDMGTIGSYRAMDGYCPPCIWVNSRGERSAVRLRWLSRQRPQTLTRFEAEELAGFDPDAVARDLAAAIESGERVQYELAAQIIDSRQLEELDFDPFDPTAMWSQERFALQKLGLLTLNRLPEHMAKELKAERFCTENLIGGIEYPEMGCADGIAAAGRQLKLLGEFSRRTLAANIAEDIAKLSPELMEQVLILFTQAELDFGRMLTSALDG